MSKEELIQLFDEFISREMLANDFNQFLEEKGYSEKEYDDLMQQLD